MYLNAITAAALLSCLSKYAFGAPTTTSSCSSDACLSTVLKGFPGATAPGPGGCSGFFLTTVIPAPVTSTVSVTLTDTVSVTSTTSTTQTTLTTTTTTTFGTTSTSLSTATVQASFHKRDSPSAITTSWTTVPSYAAKVCSNTQRYSSACSCMGRTHSTTTLPTLTTTVTSTFSTTATDTQVTTLSFSETSTSTKIDTSTSLVQSITTAKIPLNPTALPSCPQPQPNFYLKVGADYPDTRVANHYVSIETRRTRDREYARSELLATRAKATAFTRNQSCQWLSADGAYVANVFPNPSGPFEVFFNTTSTTEYPDMSLYFDPDGKAFATKVSSANVNNFFFTRSDCELTRTTLHWVQDENRLPGPNIQTFVSLYYEAI